MCGTGAAGMPDAAEGGSFGAGARLCAGAAALAGPLSGPPLEGGGRPLGMLLPGADSRAPFACMPRNLSQLQPYAGQHSLQRKDSLTRPEQQGTLIVCGLLRV